MNSDYQDIIEQVSTEIAKKMLDTEENLTARARFLDADISEITRQIGLTTTTRVCEQLRDDAIKKNKMTAS
jgi:hypothetical protein